MIDWLLALLASILAAFAPPGEFEDAKAAAAVSVAASSMVAGDDRPRPDPRPGPRPDVCPDCKGSGWIVHGDGHRTPCPCGIEPKLPSSIAPEAP